MARPRRIRLVESDHVVGVVSLLHPLRFGGILFLEIGIIDRAEILRVSVDGRRGVPNVGEGSQRPLLPVVLPTVGSRVGEDNEVLLVVGVCPFDQPHSHTVVQLIRHIQYQLEREQAIERYIQLVFLAWTLVTFAERANVAF